MDDARSPRLPHEVFLCIIAVINDSRVPFEHAAYFRPSCDSIQSLKALSLTHRSLTIPAQRALGSRLSAASSRQVSGLLRSPLLSVTSTRELTLILMTTLRATPSHEHHRELTTTQTSGASDFGNTRRLQDMVSSSLVLLQRVPNLRALRVICPLFSSEEDHLETLRLVEGIGAHGRCLSFLCWTGPEYADERDRLNVEEIWHCLGEARRSLKVLSLRNVELQTSDPRDVPRGAGELQENEDQDEEDQDSDCAMLRELTIIKVDSKMFPTPRSTSYLTRLFGRGSLQTLAIDLTSETTSANYTSDLIRILGSASTTSSWSSLERLRLRIGVGSCRIGTDTPALLECFFLACQRLRHLQLWVGRVRRMALNTSNYNIANSNMNLSIDPTPCARTATEDEGFLRRDNGEFSKIFLPAVVSATEAFVPVLLSSAGSCRALESVHLGFFHIAGPLGGHRWRSLDKGVAIGLVRGPFQAVPLGMRHVLIDSHEESFDFPCARQACAEVGCEFEKRRDASSAFF